MRLQIGLERGAEFHSSREGGGVKRGVGRGPAPLSLLFPLKEFWLAMEVQMKVLVEIDSYRKRQSNFWVGHSCDGCDRLQTI